MVLFHTANENGFLYSSDNLGDESRVSPWFCSSHHSQKTTRAGRREDFTVTVSVDVDSMLTSKGVPSSYVPEQRTGERQALSTRAGEFTTSKEDGNPNQTKAHKDPLYKEKGS